jgi:hypothetical protein
VLFNQVRRHFIIVIYEQDIIPTRHLQASITRSALAGFVLENHSQWQVIELIGQSFVASVGAGLIYNDNLERENRLLTQLAKESTEIGVTVYGGD